MGQVQARLRAALLKLLVGPQLIGLAVQEVVKVQLLREYADAVLDMRDRARRAWKEMLEPEVRLLVFDGFSLRLAEQAAKNNLALRKLALDKVEITELARLQAQLR